MPEIANTHLAGDANLLGYWKLEDANDSSGSGYNLTGTAPTYSIALYGKGGDFESGSSQYLSIADASCPNLEISGDQTWSAWIKAESVPDTMGIMTKRLTDGVFKGLRVLATSYIRFELTGLTTATLVDSASTISTGTWYHVCGVYDSTEEKIKVFVNGTKTDTAASGSATDTNGNFYVGAREAAGPTQEQFMDGFIDDAAIFNRALSDAEVVDIYEERKRSTVLI